MKDKNKIIRSIDQTGTFRVYFADTQKMVQDIVDIHNTTPTASAALGRTVTAASMMGLMLKGENEKLTITIDGGGPAGKILAIADSKGNVKGLIENPGVDLPLTAVGKLNVGGAVGNKGKITVIKDIGLKDPYVGQTDIISGEIAEDFTAYFAYSEQQPSSVALGVLVETDYSIKAAGGFIIQILPDANDEILAKLEERITKLLPVTTLLSQEKNLEEIHNEVFEGFGMNILDKIEPALKCDCSYERLERALISIGKKDLQEILEQDQQAELTCHFCQKKYLFDKEHLEKLINSI